MTELVVALVVLKLLVAGLGTAVAVLTYRSYQKTQIQGLQYFAAGLFVLTIATASVGGIYAVFSVSLAASLLVETAVIVGGFVVLLYALSLM